jgi:hypothetical protein
MRQQGVVLTAIASALLAGWSPQAALAADNQPPHGALGRALFGDEFGTTNSIKLGGWLEVGLSINDHSSGSQGKGLANSPQVIARDEGLQLNQLYLYFERDIRTNIIPRATPIPAPVFQDYAFGWHVSLLYGRDGQPVQTFGLDDRWSVNEPGNDDPNKAREDRQNFLVAPQIYLQGYLPWHLGMSFLLGTWMSPIGHEIGFQFEPGPNIFYSRTYAFASAPIKHTGLLWAANLLKDDRAGLLAAEFGVAQGWSNFKDNNDKPAYLFNLRYRGNGMDTWVDYELITGDGQADPQKAGFPPAGPADVPRFASRANIPVTRVISPRGQTKTQQHLTVSHQFDEFWRGLVELTHGRFKGDGAGDTIDIITGPGFRGANWSGVQAQVQYKWDDALSLAGRVEQFRDKDGFAIFPNGTARTTYNAVTFGAQWRLNKHLLLRPELRHDWQSQQLDKAFNFGQATRQTTFNVDSVFYF